ncbi:MAG: PEP-utilizing enzyme [archaeon]|jgi:phosphohistidine swiveling domain-containing protein
MVLKESCPNLFSTGVDWQLYLSRPFSIFESSLWHSWFSSEELLSVLGVVSPKGLYIEYPKEISNNYRDSTELKNFSDSFELIPKTNREKSLALLKKGLELNNKTIELIKSNSLSLEEAVNHLTLLAVHSTIAPFFIRNGLEKHNLIDEEIATLADELRKKSFYPDYLEKVIFPIAQKRIESLGFEKDCLPFITYKDLIKGNTSTVLLNKEKSKQGLLFVYDCNTSDENVTFVEDTSPIIKSLNKDFVESKIGGCTAYSGKVIGKVHLVFTNNPKGIIFDQGDILVAIHTSPRLSPLFDKAGAIVTDEGGIACHAAIISREMHIPCIVGTKNATKILHDGDLVEVDASKGTVKILTK